MNYTKATVKEIEEHFKNASRATISAVRKSHKDRNTSALPKIEEAYKNMCNSRSECGGSINWGVTDPNTIASIVMTLDYNIPWNQKICAFRKVGDEASAVNVEQAWIITNRLRTQNKMEK